MEYNFYLYNGGNKGILEWFNDKPLKVIHISVGKKRLTNVGKNLSYGLFSTPSSFGTNQTRGTLKVEHLSTRHQNRETQYVYPTHWHPLQYPE